MKLWIKTAFLAPVGALLLGMSTPALADGPGKRARIADRIEDRIDRRENRRDERVDHGRWDRIEDRLDRREDRFDRNHGPRASRISSRIDRRLDRRERRHYRTKVHAKHNWRRGHSRAAWAWKRRLR